MTTTHEPSEHEPPDLGIQDFMEMIDNTIQNGA